jgi:hypothetical protein
LLPGDINQPANRDAALAKNGEDSHQFLDGGLAIDAGSGDGQPASTCMATDQRSPAPAWTAM